MILEFEFHKEGRDFSSSPVTGHYTSVTVFIQVKGFSFSPFSNSPAQNYPFAFVSQQDSQKVLDKVNNRCGSKVLILFEGQLRLSGDAFPKIIQPEDVVLPVFYETNPTRLVDVISC